MNGVHDMGGMHGFGPIEPEANEPVFHAAWEGRIFGMMLSGPRVFSRFAIESIEPARYLASSYYERWMLAMEKVLMDRGMLTAEEVDARIEFYRENPEAGLPRRDEPELSRRALEQMYSQRSPQRDVGDASRFGVGDQVRTRNINPVGHTRLPRYARGKPGVIHRVHGVYEFQDTVPDGVESPPQAVYNVRFEAHELWGESARKNESVYIDMWESYLEPA